MTSDTAKIQTAEPVLLEEGWCLRERPLPQVYFDDRERRDVLILYVWDPPLILLHSEGKGRLGDPVG